MTKRDFEAIAKVIADQDFLAHEREDLVRDLSAYFVVINPRFSEDRFREACQP